MNLVQILTAAVAVHGEAVTDAGQHQGGHDGGEDLGRKVMTDVRQANEQGSKVNLCDDASKSD